jgi:hypothetical protein
MAMGVLMVFFPSSLTLDKIVENPSFQYALQMEQEEQIANIF